MGFQDTLVLVQTIICAASLIVSIIALSTANSVKKKVEKSDDHSKKKGNQIAIGKKNKQTIK